MGRPIYANMYGTDRVYRTQLGFIDTGGATGRIALIYE
jgi:hypothetical protein